jgi:signal peptidase II
LKVLIISVCILFIDQISKLLVKGFSLPLFNISHDGMSIGQRIPVIGDYFNLSFVENPGIAFGIDFGGEYKLLLSLFTIAAAAGMILYLYYYRNAGLPIRFSIALIIGGALGNLTDRIFYGAAYGYAPLLYGKVVDFFEINLFSKIIGNYIFNIADIAVCTGMIMLLTVFKKQITAEKEDAAYPEILAENRE